VLAISSHMLAGSRLTILLKVGLKVPTASFLGSFLFPVHEEMNHKDRNPFLMIVDQYRGVIHR